LTLKQNLPVDGADAGDAVVVAHSLGQEPVPDLPGEHGGVLAFVIGDLVDHFGSSNLWFGSPDHPGADAARLVVPGKSERYLDACVGSWRASHLQRKCRAILTEIMCHLKDPKWDKKSN